MAMRYWFLKQSKQASQCLDVVFVCVAMRVSHTKADFFPLLEAIIPD